MVQQSLKTNTILMLLCLQLIIIFTVILYTFMLNVVILKVMVPALNKTYCLFT